MIGTRRAIGDNFDGDVGEFVFEKADVGSNRVTVLRTVTMMGCAWSWDEKDGFEVASPDNELLDENVGQGSVV